MHKIYFLRMQILLSSMLDVLSILDILKFKLMRTLLSFSLEL